MKVLRIEVTQQAAHYRRAETVGNKMTYPLPFPSTIIGAFHAACGYKTYHPMDVSIQGEYAALQEEVYVDHCFLNSTMDDRGILVKVPNGQLLSNQFELVAKAKKTQGNSFKKGITIDVVRPDLLTEYRQLLATKEQLDTYKKTTLAAQTEPLKAKEAEWKGIAKTTTDKETKQEAKEKANAFKEERKRLEEAFKQRERDEYTIPISRFKNLTTGPKRYEILYDVHLILHVRSSEDVLRNIYEAIDNLQSIGRSEDFVNVTQCRWVEVTQDVTSVADPITSPYSMYVHTEDIVREDEDGEFVGYIGIEQGNVGTLYYATKKYHIDGRTGKRIFSRVPVVYVGTPMLEPLDLVPNDRVWVDESDAEERLLVNFL